MNRCGLNLTSTIFRWTFVEKMSFLRRVINHVRSKLIIYSFDRSAAVILLEFFIYCGDGISEW